FCLLESRIFAAAPQPEDAFSDRISKPFRLGVKMRQNCGADISPAPPCASVFSSVSGWQGN
ncbi:MAG TPA: hypothetical protein VGA75_04080, partial [Paracoccaceae bacterium]